jgi:hypothetical protein
LTQEWLTQGDDQAASAAKQLMRLANMQPSAQQPHQDPDELTKAEIDSVCKHSAPRKSGRKWVLTKHALEHAQQSPAPAHINDSTSFFASYLIEFITHSSSAIVVNRKWLVSLTSSGLPWNGIMCHLADLKVVDGDKLRQRISNLPAWAVPLPAALEAVIRSVMGVDDLEWDPMANGTIALKFDMEQVWMARRNIKIYIAYRPSTPTPQYMRIH